MNEQYNVGVITVLYVKKVASIILQFPRSAQRLQDKMPRLTWMGRRVQLSVTSIYRGLPQPGLLMYRSCIYSLCSLYNWPTIVYWWEIMSNRYSQNPAGPIYIGHHVCTYIYIGSLFSIGGLRRKVTEEHWRLPCWSIFGVIRGGLRRQLPEDGGASSFRPFRCLHKR